MSTKPIDVGQLKMLRGEIAKVRHWLNGFHAGRHVPGQMQGSIIGEDGLRQTQVLFDALIQQHEKRKP